MIAIKKARKLIENKPNDEASLVLAELVIALETDQSFLLSKLYALDFKRFELAMEILNEWRLDRYYASKLRLIDASSQLADMRQAPAQEPAPAVPTSAAPAPVAPDAKPATQK